MLIVKRVMHEFKFENVLAVFCTFGNVFEKVFWNFTFQHFSVVEVVVVSASSRTYKIGFRRVP